VKRATGVVPTDCGGISVHDYLRRMPIASLRAQLVEVVGQVGANDRQHVAVDAKGVQHVGHPAPLRSRRPRAATEVHPWASTRCRNGSCTSIVCSGRWGRSSTVTHSCRSARTAHVWTSTYTSPIGVANAAPAGAEIAGQGHEVSRPQHGDATHRPVAQPVTC
jgi:hypothetical protein